MIRQLLGMFMLEISIISIPARPQVVLQQNIPDFTPKHVFELSTGVTVSRTGTVAVQAHDSINGDLINMCYDELDIIPDCFLHKFNDLGWNLYIVDWDINTNILNGAYGSVAGVTVTAQDSIYLEDRANAIENATVHEFGHFVDYMYDDYVPQSSCEEFQEIYKEEKSKSGFNSYCCSLSTEWFAELFYMTYKNPTYTSERCPRGYEYVKRLERSLCED